MVCVIKFSLPDKWVSTVSDFLYVGSTMNYVKAQICVFHIHRAQKAWIYPTFSICLIHPGSNTPSSHLSFNNEVCWLCARRWRPMCWSYKIKSVPKQHKNPPPPRKPVGMSWTFKRHCHLLILTRGYFNKILIHSYSRPLSFQNERENGQAQQSHLRGKWKTRLLGHSSSFLTVESGVLWA